MAIINFTGVEEASEMKDKLKEGYYYVQITKAKEDCKAGGNPYFYFEYTVRSGQFKDKTIVDVISTVGQTPEKTKKLYARIQKMSSRILNQKQAGNIDFNPAVFLDRMCMIKIVQKWKEASGSYSAGYKPELVYACHKSAADYKPEYDEQLKNCAAYQAQLDNKESGTAEAATGNYVTDSDVPF